MRKFIFFFLSACTMISCSDDNGSSSEINPNLLQRIDFFPGTVSEKRWLFNSNGSLFQITKADGTVLQDFNYDSNNRLISAIHNENGFIETHTFTYDNNGFVATVDGMDVHYNSSLSAYYTGDLNTNYRLTKINSEKLPLDGRSVFIENDESGITQTEWYEMLVYYTNNNVTGYSPSDSCVSFSYDNKTNPLRNGTLAICRAFSFIAGSSWIDGQYNSVNNPVSQNYCSEDPESSRFQYNYNSNDLPVNQTRDDYYFGVYENTTLTAKYYYQGDVLP